MGWSFFQCGVQKERIKMFFFPFVSLDGSIFPLNKCLLLVLDAERIRSDTALYFYSSPGGGQLGNHRGPEDRSEQRPEA